MSTMKKLFGGISMTWRRVILFAVMAAAYTALIKQVPFLKETSFQDIAITFEWWILFALIIITNCRKPLEAACKSFVFFLVSQPLIYLIQVPFVGWSVMGYYSNWILWTVLTFPMGFVGWYVKRGSWLSLLILSSMTVLLAVHAVDFFQQAWLRFPHHLLSGIFCLVQIAVLLTVLFPRRRVRAAGFAVAGAALAVGAALTFLSPMNFTANLLLPDGNDSMGAGWQVELADGRVGSAFIQGERLMVRFDRPGETVLTVTDGEGRVRRYSVACTKEMNVTVELLP